MSRLPIAPHLLIRGLLLLTTLTVGAYALQAAHLLGNVNEAWIDSTVRGQSLHGELLFVGIGALVAAIGLPRQLVCFLGGYGFGLIEGTLLGLLASVLGCVGTFYYARLLARHLVLARFAQRIARLDDFLRDNTLGMTLLARLLPVGSNLVNTLIAGVSSVRALPFFVGSALGYLPQTLVFALAGSGVNLDPARRIGLAVALFAISAALGVMLYRKYRHGRNIDDDIARDLQLDTDAPPR
jgi:uncharacterized membrane protein YdjX (TVP38/TMEM64 family)